jgi:hypothetical protein
VLCCYIFRHAAKYIPFSGVQLLIEDLVILVVAGCGCVHGAGSAIISPQPMMRRELESTHTLCLGGEPGTQIRRWRAHIRGWLMIDIGRGLKASKLDQVPTPLNRSTSAMNRGWVAGVLEMIVSVGRTGLQRSWDTLQ